MDAEKTGKLIRDLRIEKGMTQQGLAEALNVTPTAISKWENGHSLPDISMLEPLAAILKWRIIIIEDYKFILNGETTAHFASRPFCSAKPAVELRYLQFLSNNTK